MFCFSDAKELTVPYQSDGVKKNKMRQPWYILLALLFINL